ncbi:OsmC family protein [Aliikangiella maris]|uniref:OsmC family protein n=2 Tax=Aliikangiella maris TaxID=3162458 RepID=A0ABV3MSS4_9GAMM
MSEYFAKVAWARSPDENYIDNQYSRGHQWFFDGGAVIQASSSPHVVPLPFSIPQNIDPEEAFIASLSSCHMLFFLSIAAKKKFVVDKYEDNAVGIMEKNKEGKIVMTKVILKPYVKFSGENQPTLALLEKIHHQAHEQCFIANSVKTKVITEIVL